MPIEEGFQTQEEFNERMKEIYEQNRRLQMEVLKHKYDLPDNLLEVAYAIWEDGKND